MPRCGSRLRWLPSEMGTWVPRYGVDVLMSTVLEFSASNRYNECTQYLAGGDVGTHRTSGRCNPMNFISQPSLPSNSSCHCQLPIANPIRQSTGQAVGPVQPPPVHFNAHTLTPASSPMTLLPFPSLAGRM